MILDSIIILSFIGTISLMIFSLGYIYYLYKKDKEFEKNKGLVYSSSQKMLDTAHGKAKQILEEASIKATQMIQQADYLTKDISGQMDRNLEKVMEENQEALGKDSSQFETSYKEYLDSLKARYMKETEEMLRVLKSSVEKEFGDFKAVLEKQTQQVESSLGKNMNEEYDKLTKELESYKQEQIKLINERIKKQVLQITQAVLGKAILPTEHEKLIFQALEQAKKEGMFD